MATLTTLLSGYAGLLSAISANGTPTELASSNGYARQPVTVYYDSTTGGMLVGGVEFGPGTGAWTAAVAAGIFDASTGGNLVMSWPIASFAGASGTSCNIPGFGLKATGGKALGTITPAGTVLGAMNPGGVLVTSGPAALNLSSTNAWSAAPPLSALVYGATLTPNAATSGPRWFVTLTGNLTLNVPTNPVAGQEYIWEFIQDATGSRLLTLGTGFKTAGGAPALSTAAGAVDIYRAIYDGTTFYGVLSKAYA
jgi:hypothetical protein